MTSAPPSRPKFGLSTEPPAGRRALLFAALWLVLAVIAAAAAILVAVDLPVSPVWRLVLVVVLIPFGMVALMLASDSAARWLPAGPRRLSGPVQWLSTSFVGLAVVVVFGAVVTLLVYSRSNVPLDFGVDAGLGLAAGAAAVALIIAVADGLGEAIWRVQHWLRIADRAEQRWARAEAGQPWRWGEIIRGLAFGAIGVLLSALFTALVIPDRGTTVDSPRGVENSVPLTVILPVLIWFVGTGVAWLVLTRTWKVARPPHGRLRHGTHASAVALCLAIGAVWFAAAGVERTARDGLWSGRPDPTVPTVPATGAALSLRSPYLAEQFEPQFLLASGERWQPTAITWYVQHTHLNRQPPFCSGSGCREISTACDVAVPAGSCAPSGANDPALYYRFKDLSNDATDKTPGSPPGPWTVIQYWIFYNYDSLRAGPITQWHESDWEQVSVLVVHEGNVVRPVEVAFSEHCYGAVVPAERVRWAGGAGAHPLSYVGLGSHANYPRRINEPIRQLRCSLGVTPRYLGVAGLFFSPAFDGTRLELPIAYVIGLRDKADAARAVPMAPLLPLDTTPQIASFKGNWGLDNNLSFYGVGRLRASAGPGAPQLQGPSVAPFRSMFCAHQWLGRPSSPPAETAWTCR